MGVYVRFQDRNFDACHVASFLRTLLRHLRGHIILLWDNSRIHKGSPVRKVLAANPRLHVEWLPAYAPELNPVEQIWLNLKGQMANSILETRRHVRRQLHIRTRRVRGSQDALRSFVLASDLPSLAFCTFSDPPSG